MVDSELAYASAARIALAIRSRELSALEAVDYFTARIERRNPSLNTFVHEAFDEARVAAAEADRRLATGEEIGPLHGVPTAIKDLFDFKPGWPATFGGIPALRDFSIDTRCIWAERMEAAGAILLGKTNSPVMGYRGTCDNPLFGPTGNPFDPSRNSGGSSGGGAAAVADGMLPFAEGTDGGGSVRIPAAWCGIYGYKQSWGRVPYAARPNQFGITTPFVHEGLLTRTVEDAAIGLTALAGPDPRDPFAFDERPDFTAEPRRSIEGMRIAWSPDFGGFPVEEPIAAQLAEAVRAFESAGAHVEQVELELPRDQFELGELWCRLIAPLNLDSLEGLAEIGYDLLGEHRDQMPAPFLRFMDEALETTTLEFARQQRIRTEVLDMIEGALAEHELLVTPTLACMPVPNASDGETIGPSEVNGVAVDPSIGWCLTYPVNFSGHPAASVPAGLVDGLPVGMQLIGRLRRDDDVLAASGAFERARPWASSYSAPAERELTT